MSLSQRDIVMIPVPFTDLTASKRRPLSVLSSNSYNSQFPDMVVAAVTSNLASRVRGILVDTRDLVSGQLPRASLVRPDRIYTLSQSMAGAAIGTLSIAKFQEVLVERDVILGRWHPTTQSGRQSAQELPGSSSLRLRPTKTHA